METRELPFPCHALIHPNVRVKSSDSSFFLFLFFALVYLADARFQGCVDGTRILSRPPGLDRCWLCGRPIFPEILLSHSARRSSAGELHTVIGCWASCVCSSKESLSPQNREDVRNLQRLACFHLDAFFDPNASVSSATQARNAHVISLNGFFYYYSLSQRRPDLPNATADTVFRSAISLPWPGAQLRCSPTSLLERRWPPFKSETKSLHGARSWKQ